MDESITVHELKQIVEQSLKIPVAHQKLLYVGRTLVDEKTLSSYRPQLRSGSKLTLVVKEPESMKDVMHKVFKRFYSDDQADRLATEFMADQARRVKLLSLDDLERMAGIFLERGGGAIVPAAVIPIPTARPKFEKNVTYE